MSIQIKTFVILDLEATGLPDLEYNKTKITEICLVAASRNHIIDTYNQSLSMPRVLHKLSICVNPKRMISPIASQITGLYNEVLEEEQTFNDNLHNLLCSFLERLAVPVCILAHNGMKFDFPLLQAELYKCGKNLPDQVFCADTLIGFRELLRDQAVLKIKSPVNTVIQSQLTNDMAFNTTNTTSNSIENLLDCNKDDELLLSAVDSLNEKGTDFEITSSIKNLQEFSTTKTVDEQDFSSIKKCNETTPKRNIFSTLKSPPVGPSKLAPTVVTSKHSRKRLFPPSEQKEVTSPKSFRLDSLYQYLIQKEVVASHRAENDSMNLLECIVTLGPRILSWVDDNAKPFCIVKRMGA